MKPNVLEKGSSCAKIWLYTSIIESSYKLNLVFLFSQLKLKMKTYINTHSIVKVFGTMMSTAVIVTFSSVAFPQESINIRMASVELSGNTRNSYTIDIPQVSLKDVERDWQRIVGKRAKGKEPFVRGENIQEGVGNKNISPEPFTLYSKLIETTTGVRITVLLGQNDVVSVSGFTNTNQGLVMQEFMTDFAVSAYREAVETELKVEAKKLSDLESGISKAIKTEEKTNMIITENERDNERAAYVIATNKRDIKRTTHDITDQKEVVFWTAALPNANKGAKKTLDEMKDEKRGLQNENEKTNEDISDRNKETRAADKKKDAAHRVHDTKATAIDAQREVVAGVKRKLDSIK
jgi:Sec-independent protein translocase protein TatA